MSFAYVLFWNLFEASVFDMERKNYPIKSSIVNLNSNITNYTYDYSLHTFENTTMKNTVLFRTNKTIMPIEYECFKRDYDYFGARYYDSEGSVWLSVDPMSDKHPSLSPYNYCAGNPIMLVDPDGNYLVIWYEKNGDQVPFVFKGSNYSSAPENKYVQAVLEAYKHNTKNGGGKAMKEAANSTKYNISISKTELDDKSLFKDVYWNPEEGLLTTDGDVLSPATSLEHEIDHALDYAKDPDGHFERQKKDGTAYENPEETRVIQGNETKTAKPNKEISQNKKYSRNNHSGKRVIVDGGPTSTKVNQTKTSNYEKKLEKSPKWTPEG